MSINRYRLRHLARKNNHAAIRVSRLLERPDRLLGVILIGNTFANIFASAIATVITVHYFGAIGVVIATVVMTFILLIFAEVTPKTVAALYPEQTSFPASFVLLILLKTLYPFVWLTNGIVNGLLSLFNIQVKEKVLDHLSHEELRTLVNDTMSKMSGEYKNLMLGVLDLGGITVDDIKVPRNDIIGINLDDDWGDILEQLSTGAYTRLPIYRESIDDVLGILHVRKVMNLFSQQKLNKHTLLNAAEEVYFIPEGTSLNVQLMNFRLEKKRIGLVVDEYGDIQGLITLEDILEEIVGEFTTDIDTIHKDIRQQKDGSYFIDGSVSVRELNRLLHWQLPTKGPKTLNGLIVEHLEMIPESAVCLKIADYPLEIIEIEENTVKTVHVLRV